ncbi:MAG: hypothetical protein HN413_13370 [Chloroflexi bacterium]|jgi:hypothetical protein|nr:hypothetical protein [Chloroflexota bacterium]
MSTKADETFQESLQGLANWIQFLELKQTTYRQQLERARKQNPDAAPTPSVFSEMDALRATPTPAVAHAAGDAGLGEAWLVAEPDVAQPPEGDPLVTSWREDDPEMAAWDLPGGADPIEEAWALVGNDAQGAEKMDPAAKVDDVEEKDDPLPPVVEIPADDLEEDGAMPSWL